MFSARTIIEDDEVAEWFSENIEAYPRLEDLIFALKWRLAHEPETGVPVPGTNYYIAKTAPLWDVSVPTVRVLYDFNENEVTFRSAEIVETQAGDVQD